MHADFLNLIISKYSKYKIYAYTNYYLYLAEDQKFDSELERYKTPYWNHYNSTLVLSFIYKNCWNNGEKSIDSLAPYFGNA